MNKKLENLIDTLVKAIDEDLFEEIYNEKTSTDPDGVEEERDILRDILEPYLDDSELLKSLYQAGVEDFEGYEEAVALYGKPVRDE